MLIIKHHFSRAKGSRLTLLHDTLVAYFFMQSTLHPTVNFIKHETIARFLTLSYFFRRV